MLSNEAEYQRGNGSLKHIFLPWMLHTVICWWKGKHVLFQRKTDDFVLKCVLVATYFLNGFYRKIQMQTAFFIDYEEWGKNNFGIF